MFASISSRILFAMAAVLLAAPACSDAAAPGGSGGASTTSTATVTGGGGGVAVDPCADGIKDGDETDVDCGGSCAPCAPYQGCWGPQDCASGTTCTMDYRCSFPPACNDVCAPVHQGSCDAMPCEQGQFCVPASGEDAALCFPLAGPGEPCGQCIDGYFCSSPEDICKPKAPAGGACDQTLACPDGYYCFGTCEKRLGAGEPCMVFDACNLDLYCDFALPTGQAVCAPRGAAGEGCHHALGSCLDGLKCVFPAGLPCESSHDCNGNGGACCATPSGAACAAPAPGCVPPSGKCQ